MGIRDSRKRAGRQCGDAPRECRDNPHRAPMGRLTEKPVAVLESGHCVEQHDQANPLRGRIPQGVRAVDVVDPGNVRATFEGLGQ